MLGEDMFSNKTYNILKFIALVVLPAAIAAYSTIAAIWGIPDTKEVAGSIAALGTFLGAVLHISSAAYKPAPDGKIVIDNSDPEKTVARIDFDQGTELKHGKMFKLAIVDAENALKSVPESSPGGKS